LSAVEKSWHAESIEAVLREFYTGPQGLSQENARERLGKYGRNELKEKDKKSAFVIFFAQFNSFIIWILIIATVISYLFGHHVDAIVILIILVLNAVLGFIQEYRAEKSIEALRKLAALQAKVIRGGLEIRIDTQELVPGDIIVIETGDKIPADARLIDCRHLETDESSLTGESTTVKKDPKPVRENAPLAERASMVFSGTVIAAGRATAVVIATGMATEIGKIAGMVQSVHEKETPLQHQLAKLGEYLGIMVLVICGIVFIIEILKSGGLSGGLSTETLIESFMNSVSLAVAAIPEGLPAIVTVCLALGVQRMAKKNALIRVLPAVQTLGSCNVICTDKTGTLTYNQMTVRELYVNHKKIVVTGQGYVPEGQFEFEGDIVPAREFEHLLKSSVLCNDAQLSKRDSVWEIIGDPTEAALIVAARKGGIIHEKLNIPRVDEIPFDSDRKLMTTVHEAKGYLAYVKGAPESVIDRCTRIEVHGRVRAMTARDRDIIQERNLQMANRALRVLGFAYKPLRRKDEKNIESGLIFLGLIGMIDPPRHEVVDAIRRCKEAGIRVIMITGDHKATAIAIGKELGIEGEVLIGPDIESISDLAEHVGTVAIYARVSPQHKMRIINALKAKGAVVAMTGDGVNDAPALKRADIGVAMGKSGTDVAREASDMILTDDNFTSIVNAVEEGRGIYDNIKKFVKYLLSSNLGEILTIFAALLLGIGYTDPNSGLFILPVLAIQLLWINLLTDGLPALALGVEPTDPDVMHERPRSADERIITSGRAISMFMIGSVMALGTLLIYYNALVRTGDGRYAGTMAFTSLVMFQLCNVLNVKSETKSIFRSRITKNPWLLIAIASSLLLQLIVIYTPFSSYLKTVPLSLADWGILLIVASSVIVLEEVRKFVARHAHG
jgi:P-type Ca2+ transporter type 2C